MGSAVGRMERWRSRTVSRPSDQHVRCGFSWHPGECTRSSRRRVGLGATLGPHPTRVREGGSCSSSRVHASGRVPTRTATFCGLASPLRPSPPSRPPVIGPSGRGRWRQSRRQPSRQLQCSAPRSAAQRSATFRGSWRPVFTASVTSRDRPSVSASPVTPDETRAAHVVSRNRSAGATDAGRQAVSGRHAVV
jgi:hypothetical protein